MSELLKKVAKLLGVPENLIQRSAEARADASGKSPEEVLQSWSGGETVEETEESSQQETVEETEESSQQETVEETEESPQQETVRVSSLSEDIVIANIVLGIRERGNVNIPRWINATFIVIPVLLLIGLISTSNIQKCGENGILSVDRKTQTAVNCDGSKFEGKLVSINKVNYIALGQEIYSGSAACAGCHGSSGGGGVGPTFIGGELYTTFPTCNEHVKWVQLGSLGWQSEVGSEYGASNKISIGGMPSFQGKLSDEEIRAVVTFERVIFGGEATETVLEDCGLVDTTSEEITEEAVSSMP
jgi:hypothetical protein